VKIVIYSSTFSPNIGGVETIMQGLAEAWSSMGHNVIVFTSTPQLGHIKDCRYKVVKKKSIWQLNSEINKADIYLEANISFKNCISGLIHKKKWFIVHHTHYDHQNRIIGFFKSQLTKLSKNICVSRFIADKIPAPAVVIHNFYLPIFSKHNGYERKIDFAYLGRLVSDKGVDKLCEALTNDEWQGNCLIIGDGPDRALLEKLVNQKNRYHQFRFTGTKKGVELVDLLNQVKVLVIPSLWEEPFGVIALEGMACGCIIACSNKLGLKEATGDLAFFFDPNNERSILETLKKALAFIPTSEYAISVKNHLQKHEQKYIAQQYLDFFENSSI
jgi:glycosyltransferase involved in cell wall biosynthesis